MLALFSSLQYKPKGEIRLSRGWQVPRSFDERDECAVKDECGGDGYVCLDFQQPSNEHLSYLRSVSREAGLSARMPLERLCMKPIRNNNVMYMDNTNFRILSGNRSQPGLTIPK
jgi:hypothetical protein